MSTTLPKFRDNGRRKSSIHSLAKITIEQPILIVEDQNSLAQMLASLLIERWGVTSHIANSQAQAKSLLKQHRHEYLVAICDLHLPDAPNGEVIDLVHRANVPIITLTGSFDKDFNEASSTKGVVDYIQKDSVRAYHYVVETVGRLYKNQSTKVLVVEDSLSTQALMQHMLEIQNFKVYSAQ